MSEAPMENEAPVIEAPESAAPEADEFEGPARAGGWVPKEEFQGPPDKWKDAKSYVLHAAEILPSLTKDLRETKAEIKDVRKTLKDFGDYHTKTAAREYDRALKDIEKRLNEATATGDTQGAIDAAEDLAELRADERESRRTQGQGADLPEFESWRAENPWYGTDKVMTAACVAIGEEVFAEGYSGAAQIKEVDRRIREAFPQKFARPENPNRRMPGAVEGAGAPLSPRGKSYVDLPADAKAECEYFVKNIKGFTREQYVKDFDWSAK